MNQKGNSVIGNQSIVSEGALKGVTEGIIEDVLEDLSVRNAEAITGGSTIRVNYDTGFGNSIGIRGSEAPAN